LCDAAFTSPHVFSVGNVPATSLAPIKNPQFCSFIFVGQSIPLHKKELPHVKEFLRSTRFVLLEKALRDSANNSQSDKKIEKRSASTG